jgi:hypothetical protein
VSTRTAALTLMALLVAGAGGAAEGAVRVRAELDRTVAGTGEPVTLAVVVEGSVAGVGEPEFEISPAGVAVRGGGSSRNLSWVNGQSSSETVFRYELVAGSPGRYAIRGIRVRVGREWFMGGALALEVRAVAQPASLVMDVTPPEPWVGQPVMLRLRLIEHLHVEDWTPYQPSDLTGFWAEPESKAATSWTDASRTLRMVETRRQLYALAAGKVTIGSASANLALAAASSDAPTFGRERVARVVLVESGPVTVRVRALPPGAPAGFGGAVGDLEGHWSCDRGRTPLDVPVELRLDVRGVGNLPLVHAPELSLGDWEVFSGTVEDSLSAPGSGGGARRTFRWTLLPRRRGMLDLPVPDFVWFDPVRAGYRRGGAAVLSIGVGSPIGPGAREADSFPAVFAAHPVDPFARGARPWAAGLAGALIGVAVALWRRGGAADTWSEERSRRDALVGALNASGADVWRVASEACAWLESRGRALPQLSAEIGRARFGGSAGEPSSVRARLRAELSGAVPANAGGPPLRIVAAALVVLGGVALSVALPGGGDARAVSSARAADDRVRAGDLPAARAVWDRLWGLGGHAPGLAARMAWSELRAGRTGGATVWVVRGSRGEARDPAIAWAWERVRETGGLLGAHPPRPPLRSLELAAVALIAGLLAGAWWRRQAWCALAAAVMIAAAAVVPVRALWAERSHQAVVMAGTILEGPNLELEAGQVVRVLRRAGARVRVSAGADLSGWVSARIVEVVR